MDGSVMLPVRTLSIVCLVSFASCCIADTIVLDNGSRLVGKVVALNQGKVSLETDFAGTLSLAIERIANLQTDGALRFRLPGARETEGTLAMRDGKATIQGADAPVQVPVTQIDVAGPAGQPLPAEPAPAPKHKWSYEVNTSFRGKSGNTDSKELGFGAAALRKSDEDRLRLYAAWNRDEKNGTKTEDEMIGGVDYERELNERFSWYARTELERDDIEMVSLRATVAGGLGYYMIKNNVRELRFRSGLQYQRESYDYEAADKDSLGMEFGLRHCWNISDWGKLVNDVTYSAAFDDWQDYRIVHESSLDIPLAKSQLWKVRLGLAHEYNSLSAPGTEDLDTTYFLKLVFNWR
jgi:putative salt-induced outer membrane protein YdiY